MRELQTLPPPRPLGRRWSTIIWAVVIIGLVVAFIEIPSWNRAAGTAWDAGRDLFRKLFKF
jgi:hypothetical protein